MKLLKVFVLLTLLVSVHCSSLFSRELEKYKGDITVPIQEDDIVYARNIAFQRLQSILLSAAINDLIGGDLYEEYREEISRNRALHPANYIVSAKVLKEKTEFGEFTLALEAIIQVSSLAEELRKMNLILKNDPWTQVDVLVDSDLKIDESALKKRLALFHIKVAHFRKIFLTGIAPEVRTSTEFVSSLFSQFSNYKIIYFIDYLPLESSLLLKTIRTQILRRSDFAQISIFQLDLPTPTEPNQIDGSTLSKYLSLFNITSIESDLYNEGLESNLVLQVEGLTNPFDKYVFEETVLQANRSIKSFTLTQLAPNKAIYQIQSSYSLEELNEFFNKNNPNFYFVTEKINTNMLLVEAFYRVGEKASRLTKWEPDQRILELIAESLHQDSLETEIMEKTEDDPLNNPVKIPLAFRPRLAEQEPNNNSQNMNLLPPATLVLGQISSRIDEDLYRVDHKTDSATILVEWTRIGKTALSPQLRLYDQNFSFITNYNLVGHQDKLKFAYTFKGKVPSRIYLRVSDKVGFIQGETGGFKSFYYLLKCSWEAENPKSRPQQISANR